MPRVERELLSVGEQPVGESGGPMPEWDVRAASHHLREAAAVLRQALAADDEVLGGRASGDAGTTGAAGTTGDAGTTGGGAR
jgi:hypothetical protein